MYDSLPIDFYLVLKRKSVLEMSKTVLSWQCPLDIKKGVPTGPPWSQATQVSATRSLDTLHRKMGFVNSINSIYGSML